MALVWNCSHSSNVAAIIFQLPFHVYPFDQTPNWCNPLQMQPWHRKTMVTKSMVIMRSHGSHGRPLPQRPPPPGSIVSRSASTWTWNLAAAKNARKLRIPPRALHLKWAISLVLPFSPQVHAGRQHLEIMTMMTEMVTKNGAGICCGPICTRLVDKCEHELLHAEPCVLLNSCWEVGEAGSPSTTPRCGKSASHRPPSADVVAGRAHRGRGGGTQVSGAKWRSTMVSK